MTTFFTDADLTGAGEFVEPEIWLATEFTVPAGTASFRWRWPTVAPVVTPVIRVFDAVGTLVAGPISFDTTTLDTWNTAGVGSPVALSAGTYRVTVNTTRYPARSGFFSGGSITRGSITAVQGRFGSPGAAPATAWPAAYFVDIDFTASGGGGGAAPTSLVVPVLVGQPTTAIPSAAPFAVSAAAALGAPTVALNRSAAPAGSAVSITLGTPTVGRNGAAPAGLAVAADLGAPAVQLGRFAAPIGIAVPVTFGVPSTNAPDRTIPRPYAGSVIRPAEGVVLRP